MLLVKIFMFNTKIFVYMYNYIFTPTSNIEIFIYFELFTIYNPKISKILRNIKLVLNYHKFENNISSHLRLILNSIPIYIIFSYFKNACK